MTRSYTISEQQGRQWRSMPSLGRKTEGGLLRSAQRGEQLRSKFGRSPVVIAAATEPHFCDPRYLANPIPGEVRAG